jgi:hypothetical protein
MPYSEPEIKVLREYGIFDDKGKPVTVELEGPKDKPLGQGPLLEKAAIDRLLKADSTPERKWLAWIFFQCAGGEKGKEASNRAMEQIKKRFIEERVNGFQHPQSKEYYAGVSRKEAEDRWEKAKHRFKEIVDIADQDAVEKLGVFGFFRHWPGQQRLYERVEKAVQGYLKLYPKLLQMNKEIRRESRDELPTEPSQISTIEQMEQITKKVDRYFASKAARDDIRADVIYDDDYVTALAPLTYAAAVKYGHDEWAWANRAKFDEVLGGEGHSYSDNWKSNTQQGKAYVYITFKVPVPSWISRKSSQFERRRLTNLALEVDVNRLKSLNPDDLVVWDEENRNTMRLRDVKEQILAEPTRPPDPQDDEIPIKRGPNVYKNKDEADQVVWHLDKAMQAIVKWAKSFDPKKVKSDALTLAEA